MTLLTLTLFLPSIIVKANPPQNPVSDKEYIEMLKQHKKKEINKRSFRDSDQDGLYDYYEQGSMLNKSKKDTDHNGKDDGQEDLDQDGLTNLKEQELNTNPYAKDSDGDGIDDLIEVNKYETDPAAKDTDFDGLSDSYEIKVKMNPLNIDSDGDGVVDGKEKQTYPLPKNRWGISGTYSGNGHIKDQIFIRDTPILLLQRMKYPVIFDIHAIAPGLTVKINIPNTKSTEKLYRFEYQNKDLNDQQMMLKPVKGQTYDSKKKSIQATVTGGDTFVVLSEKAYQNSIPKNGSVIKNNTSIEKVKVKGLPEVVIDLKGKNKNNEIEIEGKGIEYDKSTEKNQSYTHKAKYKIKELLTSDGENYATLTPITVETGKPIVILLHGYGLGDWDQLGGTSESLGLANLWDNREPSERHAQPSQWWVPKEATFTQRNYYYYNSLLYSHPDVQFITEKTDPDNIGPYLLQRGYTKNVDLYIFEYDNDAKNIYWNSELLRDFIEWVRSRTGKKVNLLAHSMGGLVSRYFIEHLDPQDGDVDVKQLFTYGTPHFGSFRAFFTFNFELNRKKSCFWNPQGDGITGTCKQLTGKHPGVRYIAFAGTNNDNATGTYGFYAVPDETNLNGSYADWVRKTVGFDSEEWIDDGIVRVDSALGSDAEVDGLPQKPTLDFDERYLIADPKYGDHSEMLRNNHVKSKTYAVLNAFGE